MVDTKQFLIPKTQTAKVAGAMLEAGSWQRAGVLIERQGGRPKSAEGHYEIRYYMVDKSDDVIPDVYNGIFEAIAPDNAVQALNNAMRISIHQAMETIQSQMPGRFRFTRVHDPKEADLLFASIPKLFTTTTDMESSKTREADGEDMRNYWDGVEIDGVILLAGSSFEGPVNSSMRYTALHEIGHALGLAHPHEAKRKKPDAVHDATFYDSVMTYATANDTGKIGLDYAGAGFPASLMPADIFALFTLYPIPSDLFVPVVAPPPYLRTRGDVAVVVHRDDEQAERLQFPSRGLVFQPLYDTKHDKVVIHGKVNPSPSDKSSIDTPEGTDVEARLLIRQRAFGLQINQMFGEGAVLLPMKAETIELARDVPQRVEVEGDVHIVVPPPREQPLYQDFPDTILDIYGRNNQVTLDARAFDGAGNTRIYVNSSAELQIAITNASQPTRKKFDIANTIRAYVADDEMDGAAHTIEWQRSSGGGYRMKVKHFDGKIEPIQIDLTVDTDDPKVHARIQWALSQPMEVTGEKRLPGDSGRRLITPKKVDEKEHVAEVSAMPSASPVTKSGQQR